MIRGSSFGARILALLISARYSDPEHFATIALFFTIAEIARLIADFGVDTYTMREYASHRNKEQLKYTIGSAVCAKLILGLMIACFALLLMLHLRNNNFLLALPFTLMIVSPLVMNLPINFFIAKMRGKHIVFFVLLTGLVSLLVFNSLFQIYPHSGIAFFVMPIIEILVGIFLIFRVSVIRQSLGKINFRSMTRLLRLSSPIAATTILGITYGRMDVFFLEKFRSTQELGLYAFSVRLVEPFQFVAGALAVNAYGHIASSFGKSKQDSIIVNAKYRKVMGIYTITALILILLIANIFLDMLFKQYFAARWMVNIFGFILIFKCGNLITTSCIQAYGKYKFITSIAIWNFCFLSISMIILVPRVGAYGALVAILTMEFINFCIQNYYLNKLLKK